MLYWPDSRRASQRMRRPRPSFGTRVEWRLSWTMGRRGSTILLAKSAIYVRIVLDWCSARSSSPLYRKKAKQKYVRLLRRCPMKKWIISAWDSPCFGRGLHGIVHHSPHCVHRPWDRARPVRVVFLPFHDTGRTRFDKGVYVGECSKIFYTFLLEDLFDLSFARIQSHDDTKASPYSRNYFVSMVMSLKLITAIFACVLKSNGKLEEATTYGHLIR
ncbi:hypothetical protein EI94DRAFT_1747320 [Lactarius quietus]|nr:hypothetical protein EI94DRAFT_1747320 [Lactarius quietus]